MKHSTKHFLTHSPRLFQEKAADFGTGTSDFSGTSDYVDKSYKLVAVGNCKLFIYASAFASQRTLAGTGGNWAKGLYFYEVFLKGEKTHGKLQIE